MNKVINQIRSMAVEMGDFNDFSYRCEPNELYVQRVSVLDRPIIYFFDNEAKDVTICQTVVSLDEVNAPCSYWKKKLDAYFVCDIHYYDWDDVFLSGECNEAFKLISTIKYEQD